MAKYKSIEEAIAGYDSGKYRTPDGYTADIAVFTIVTGQPRPGVLAPPSRTLKLLLIKRAAADAEGEPNIEGGKWALPGGFIQPDETAGEAALRELSEETGVDGIHIRHFGVYDKPGRDPRGWIISNAHYAIVPEDYLDKRQAADDAEDLGLFTLEEVETLPLAFDHAAIIRDAAAEIKRDMVQTTVARNFLPEAFTLSELRDVLLTAVDDPAIAGKSQFFDKTPRLPFIRLVTGEDGKPKTTKRNSARPSRLYAFTGEEPVSSIYS